MNTLILPGEKIIETKHCRLSGEEFVITDTDIAFYDAVSPVIGGRKFDIPTPTCSPMTRMQRRMAFRNERFLYEKKSALTGKTIVTMYHPEEDWKPIETKLWYGDDWSAYDYGRTVDFDRPVLPQIWALWKEVPMMAMYYTSNCENCEYTNWFGGRHGAKNCYFCFNGAGDEDCMYMKGVVLSRDCLEMYFGTKNEHCYECVNCNECYATFYSIDCTNCRECSFCSACIGCEHCFGCSNLANQEYCIFNKKLEKSVYEKQVKELRITHQNYPQIYTRMQAFYAQNPVRCNHNVNCENSIGDYLVDCKNVIGFEVYDCENVKFVNSSKFAKDSMDTSGYAYYSDHMLESVGSGNGARMLYTHSCEACSDILYSAWCQSTTNSFGCIGTKHGKWSILNTALSQQEYETLVPKIIDHMRSTGEWGEFFDASMSPFGYNETIGASEQPLDRTIIEKYGWRWYDIPKKERSGEFVVPLDTNEYNPKRVSMETAEKNAATLLAGVIKCEETGEPFRILKEELRFYIMHDLPIPRLHPQVRYNHRIAHMQPKKLHTDTCAECGATIMTNYDTTKRKVLCENCYRKLVY